MHVLLLEMNAGCIWDNEMVVKWWTTWNHLGIRIFHTKMAMIKYWSIITLHINGLNAPTKRHRIAERITKYDPHICCLKETTSK